MLRTLTVILLTTTTLAQKTPTGPKFELWYKEEANIKAAGIKSVKAYKYGTDHLKYGYDFNEDGYIIKDMKHPVRSIFDETGYAYSKGYHHFNYLLGPDQSKERGSWSEYDLNGYPVASFRYLGNDELDNYMNCKNYYDANGVLDSAIGERFNRYYNRYFFYDDQGRIVKRIQAEGQNPVWSWQYTLDAEGRLIDRYWWQGTGSDTSIVARTKWYYDEHGRIAKQMARGRGWEDRTYTYTEDSVTVVMDRNEMAYGPAHKWVFYFSECEGLYKRMRRFATDGKLEEDIEYRFEGWE